MTAAHVSHQQVSRSAPEQLSCKEATDLFTKQTTTINSLWQNYSAVAGVMLIGAGAASVAHPLTWRSMLALSIAFGMFSEGNFVLLWQACRIHVRLAAVIAAKLSSHQTSLDPSYRDALGTLASTANSPTWMMLYHLTIDSCVLAAIWLSAEILR